MMTVPVQTAAQLLSQGREIEVPFRICFADQGQQLEIECQQVLRLLPGKRVVCRALFEGKSVLVKLFIAQAARRHFQRELRGVELFARADVASPQLLHHGVLVDGGGFALITAFIENATTLLQGWPEIDNAQRLAWLKRTMPILAKLHGAGAIQKDIHLDNFLVADQSLFLIDGDGVFVASEKQGLSRSEIVDNIALYLAQIECQYDRFVPELLEDYNACHSLPGPVSVTEFMPRLQLKRWQRACNYARKVMRDCSEIQVDQTYRRFVAYRRELDTAAWRQWLSQLDQVIDQGQRLKDGNTATVVLAEFSGRALVIKRYNSKGLWHRLGRCWRASRAALSWQNGHLLQMVGINTPRPLALVEERAGFLRGRAFLVTEFSSAPGALDYYQPAEDGRLVDEVHRQGFIELFRTMVSARISHGDFKASNLLVNEQGVQVIDLDSMVLHKDQQPFERAFERDLQRFLRNWPQGSNLHHQFRALVEQARKVL